MSYRPTIIISISETFLRKSDQISRANIVLELLKIEVSDVIRAETILASIKPRKPEIKIEYFIRNENVFYKILVFKTSAIK